MNLIQFENNLIIRKIYVGSALSFFFLNLLKALFKNVFAHFYKMMIKILINCFIFTNYLKQLFKQIIEIFL